jgi:prepilin-type N-terminal cleavage/methylation domain-containing protein
MKGFTLIEVVIAMTIMAVLTVFSTQSIQQGLKSKAKIHQTIDDMSQVRDTLRVIERDINLAYHYRDIEMEFLAEVACRSKPQQPTPPIPAAPGAMPAPPQPGVAPSSNQAPSPACLAAFPNDLKIKEKYKNRKDPTTQFEGKQESIDFVTMNVSRVAESQVMADFAKVGYSLRPCKKLGSNGESGQCLVRRFSTLVEGDVTKGGESTILVENVSEFKLRYFGKGKQDWNSSWSSTGSDAVTKDNFPQAVEISLTIEKASEGSPEKKKKKISMQIVAPIRFPNNRDTTGGGRAVPGV